MTLSQRCPEINVLLSRFNRSLTELLKFLNDFQSNLAGASAGSFVTFLELSDGILLEGIKVGGEFFDNLFHDKKRIKG